MSFSQTTLGAIGFAALFQTMFFVLPSQKFLTVYDVRYEGGEVIADRRVNKSTVADWRVTIVPKDRTGPVCATTPGPSIHEGWSPYEEGPRGSATMSLDVWVGQVGCSALLGQEPHTMYVTWTPRDGSEPVVHRSTFTPSGDSL